MHAPWQRMRIAAVGTKHHFVALKPNMVSMLLRRRGVFGIAANGAAQGPVLAFCPFGVAGTSMLGISLCRWSYEIEEMKKIGR